MANSKSNSADFKGLNHPFNVSSLDYAVHDFFFEYQVKALVELCYCWVQSDEWGCIYVLHWNFTQVFQCSSAKVVI